jgi:probable HAF family extracellular repeat protein
MNSVSRRLVPPLLIAVLMCVCTSASAYSASPAARWVIRDLGALPGRPISTALGINEDGQIVGWSAFEFGRSKQFIDCHVVLWQRGHAVDITADGTSGCEGSLNDQGQIAFNADADAFLWENGEVTALGALPGHSTSSAKFINNAGEVVGDSWIGSPAFIWRAGKMIDLGSLGGGATYPTALSERGWVVGTSWRKPGEAVSYGFLWRRRQMLDLGTLTPYDVNSRGQVVGSNPAGKIQQGEQHAVLWAGGKLTDLGGLPRYPDSRAVAINNRGQVVGMSKTFNGRTRGFLWQSGKMIDLGTLGGCCTTPTAINERGQIIGESTVKGGTSHAFLWQDGKMIDLGTLGIWSRATALNERNQIVGESKPRRTRAHAVLWNLARSR